MMELIAAALFLLVSHMGISSGPPRPWLVARLGEPAYRGVYSLITIAALVWLVLAWQHAERTVLWAMDPSLALVPLIVMPGAIFLLVGGLSGPNPTAVGQDRTLGRSDLVRGTMRITRHPFMWATGLWSFAHLIPNGDLPSIIFFATIGILALGGTALIDRKTQHRDPKAWERFSAATSNLPFLAIVDGRQSLGAAIAEYGMIRFGIAIVIFGAIIFGHPWLSGGVSAVPFLW